MTGPTWEWWNAQLSESARQIEHACMSLHLVSELPSEISRAKGWTVTTACFESWLLNVRLLTEFFGIHPARHNSDFSAQDFQWNPTELRDQVKIELEECWSVASSFLLHFGKNRVPSDLQELDPPFDTSPANLARITSLLLEAAQAFGQELTARGHDQAEAWSTCVSDATQNLKVNFPNC